LVFFPFHWRGDWAVGRLRVNDPNREWRRVAAVTEEGAGSVQKTAGDHAVCFESRDAAQSIDVLVEVRGAPDDDHPDHQHESDCKSCEHVNSFPAESFFQKTPAILRHAGPVSHPGQIKPEPGAGCAAGIARRLD
jgi:hypothetical protein